MNVGTSRLELSGALEVANGRRELAALAMHASHPEKGPGAVGIAQSRAGEERHCLVAAPLLIRRYALSEFRRRGSRPPQECHSSYHEEQQE